MEGELISLFAPIFLTNMNLSDRKTNVNNDFINTSLEFALWLYTKMGVRGHNPN